MIFKSLIVLLLLQSCYAKEYKPFFVFTSKGFVNDFVVDQDKMKNLCFQQGMKIKYFIGGLIKILFFNTSHFNLKIQTTKEVSYFLQFLYLYPTLNNYF